MAKPSTIGTYTFAEGANDICLHFTFSEDKSASLAFGIGV